MINTIVAIQHFSDAKHVKALISEYDEIEPLLSVDEQFTGLDALAEEARGRHEALVNFLRQPPSNTAHFNHPAEYPDQFTS